MSLGAPTSAVIPQPVSRTCTTTLSSSFFKDKPIVPPPGVNFTALEIRLLHTRFKSSASERIRTPSSISVSIRRFLRSHASSNCRRLSCPDSGYCHLSPAADPKSLLPCPAGCCADRSSLRNRQTTTFRKKTTDGFLPQPVYYSGKRDSGSPR